MAGIMGAIGTGATIAITIKAIDDFSGTFHKANTSLGGLAATAGKVAVGALLAVGAALTSVAVSSVKAAAQFEQTQVAFTTMLGSAEASEAMLKKLTDFAIKTPFTLTGIEASAKQLLAMGIETDSLLPTLKSLGDVAAGLSVPLDRLALNFGQVKAQGKLTGRELRDFAIAGVPLTAELAKQLGVSEAAISEMVSAGEIGFDKVEQAFISMSSEGGRFANLMDKQSETVMGKFSNLQDTIEVMQRELGTAFIPMIAELADTFLNDLLPAIKPLIPVMTEVFMKIIKAIVPYLPQFVDGLIQFVEVCLEIFDALTPLIGPLIDISLMLLDLALQVIKPLIPLIRILAEMLASIGPILLALEPAFRVIAKVLEYIIKIVSTLVGWISKLVEWLAKITTGAITKVISSIGNLFGGKNVISVDDAIIRPNGQIIETNPMDTLIATKNPENLGNNKGITIIIQGDNYGVDADSIAQSLAYKLNNQIRI